MNRNYPARTIGITLGLCVLIVIASLGSGPGEDPYAPYADAPPPGMFPTQITVSEQYENGKHYARCLYRDYIKGAVFLLEVKNIARINQELPGITSEGIEVEQNNHVWVRLRGVAAPRISTDDNRNRPHAEVELEQGRYNDLQDQTWRLFQSSWTLVLSNIEVDPENDKRWLADIYYQVGGVDRDLAADMIADGFMIESGFARSFGQRIP